MVRKGVLPLGTRPLRRRDRDGESQHHVTDLLEQMARLRRPRHSQPLCPYTD